jgi:hypothetical protein
VWRLLTLYLSIVMSLAFLASPAAAEPPYLATCGTVRAFNEPTPTAPGSVTIGTATFSLHFGDRLPSTTPLGARMCINRTVTTAGPVLTLIAMPAPICGFAGIVEGIPGQRRELIDIVTTTPDLRIALPVSASVESVFRGAATACFEVGLDANGNVFAARVMGATVTVPATTPGPVTRLPSTATDASPTALAALVVTVWAAALFVVARRRDVLNGA